MAYDQSNVFARILRKELPANVIFESEHCLAVLDAFPCTRGHSLLIPKYPVQHLEDLCKEGTEVLGGVMKDLGELSQRVKKAVGAESTNVILNNGPASGQIVPHIHFHVIPRTKGDGLVKHPSPTNMTEAAAKELLALFHAGSTNTNA